MLRLLCFCIFVGGCIGDSKDVVVESTCGGEITGEQTLVYPRDEGYYDNNVRCTWYVTAPRNKKIRVAFTYLDIQAQGDDSTRCDDYVLVVDGRHSYPHDGPILGRYCGSKLPDDPVETTSNRVTIYFESDATDTRTGFDVKIGFVDKEEYCENQVLSSTDGYFLSPGYPSAYPNDQKCSWIIQADSSYGKVEVTFKDYELEGNYREQCYDYVAIYEGTSEGGKQVGKFCGKGDSSKSFMSKGNSLFVKFQSDWAMAKKGFKATYRKYEHIDSHHDSKDQGHTDQSHLDTPVLFDPCAVEHITCDDGSCVPLNRLCDGTKHCADGRDEVACTAVTSFECGKQAIVPVTQSPGARAAVPHSWPWQLVVEKGGQVRCSGALMSKHWMLAPRSCFDGPSSSVSVRCGEHDLSGPDYSTWDKKKIDRSINTVAPTYIGELVYVRLAEDVKYRQEVQDVCLPAPGVKHPDVGMRCIVTGWRDTTSGDSKLYQVGVTVRRNEECERALSSSFDDAHACVYSYDIHDLCEMNLGALLQCFDPQTQHYALYGLSAKRCDVSSKVAVFYSVCKNADSLRLIFPYV